MAGRSVPVDVGELLKKHAVTQQQEFLSRRTVPTAQEDKKRKRQANMEQKDTLTQWGGMKRGDQSVEAKQAIEFVRYGNYLTDKYYQRPKKEAPPQFYEFGEEIGSKTDLNAPHERKRRKTATKMVDEVLLSAAARRMIKARRTFTRGKREKADRSAVRANAGKKKKLKRRRGKPV
eukprot:TRINITY_DN48336_c0_g1_i1.p2 TRINITY_DN48336_c0_g1~~TRINITY_DN48336_c0_g1_i1.p2  ORF type:complete len:176 (+),score=81.10 TRINITY_DN48336_c0_g1_i1:97-624(+)